MKIERAAGNGGCSGQPVDNESVEDSVRDALGEQPAKMGAADSAKDDFPAMSGKPGEFAAGFSEWSYAGNLAEAANGKGQTGGIEKGVLVAVIDLDSLVAVGDY